MLQISLHYLVIIRCQNYHGMEWARLNTFIWRPRGTEVESTSRGDGSRDGTVFPCPVVSTSRPWASGRLSKQTYWCEVEVVFNERTIRHENRLGAFGERDTWHRRSQYEANRGTRLGKILPNTVDFYFFFIRLIILEDFIRLISYNGPCVPLGCSFFLATALLGTRFRAQVHLPVYIQDLRDHNTIS